jgi:hypothetical protein
MSAAASLGQWLLLRTVMHPAINRVTAKQQTERSCRASAELAHTCWCSRRESNPEPWD